jgi:ubiquitin
MVQHGNDNRDEPDGDDGHDVHDDDDDKHNDEPDDDEEDDTDHDDDDDNNGEMEIYVKNPTGETITLNVEGSYKIDTIKALIKDKTKIPRNQQRLIFADGQLEDEKTLTHYGIDGGSTLALLLRVRGGGGRPGGVKKGHLKKASERAAELKAATLKKGKEVSAYAAGLDCVKQMDKILCDFFAVAEENHMKAFEDQAMLLDLKSLQGILDITVSSAGGTTDFKLNRLARLLFGKQMQEVIDLSISFSSIIESAEGSMQWLYTHAQSKDGKINMSDLRRIVEKVKYMKEGAAGAIAGAAASSASAAVAPVVDPNAMEL